MNQESLFDHEDPSVMEEPTIRRVGMDHPNWDQSWGSKMDYELLDEYANHHIEDQKRFEAFCIANKTPFSTEPPTNIRLAVRILKYMERKGIAPKKAWLSWNCIATICQSSWVFDFLESKGIEINRTEYDNRVKGK